jgi:undecaprenyl-diphosphatase
MQMTVARAVWRQIESRDHRLMRRVHRWRAPKWIRVWMIVATRCGDGWLWYLLGAILLLFGGPQRFLAVGSAATAVGVGIVLFKLLKNTSHRARPCHLEAHCWCTILPPDRFSFPSGHSITAFAIAICIGLFYPQLQDLLLFIAVCIAASRIILGMHFLSDVVAGSIIGTALGYGAFRIFA